MFVIQKTVTGNFYHIYNNESTKVNVSDFDVVLDDVALTFIIQCKNGSNIPSQAISLSLIQVIDLSVGTSPIAFSGVDGLILLLKSISYTPYLQSLIVTTPVTVYRVGQVGVFTMTPTQFTDNFDGTGLGQSAMLGWALRNGNNGTKNQLGKFSLNKGVAPYDVIGNIGGYEDSIIVAHKHGQRSSSTTNNDAKHVKIGFTGTDTGLYQQTPDSIATNKVQVTTEEVGISGVGKNMPPYLIDVWVERVTDLVINVGQGGGGGGAVDSVNGQTGDVYIPLDYLPLAGGTMDVGADIFFDNGSALREGTYDFGGNGGISRICSVDYEDMWQAGIRHVFDNNGLIRHSTNCFDVVPDSSFDNTLRFKIDSLWTLDNGTTYKCTDASTGAAVWEIYNNFIPTLQEVTDINNVTENDLIVRSPEYERKQVVIKRATDAEDICSVFVQYDGDTYVIAYAQEGQSGIGGSVYDPAGISEFTLSPGGLSTYDSVCNMSLQSGDLSLNSYVAKPKISMVGVGGAVEIRTNLLTGVRLQELPDKDGTFAMLDDIPAAILRNNYFWFLPNTVTNGGVAVFGYSERISFASFVILLNGNLLRGMVTFATTGIAGTIASMRRNDALQIQGYECKFTRKIQFNSNVSGQRFFCGISKGNQFAVATNVEPNTLTDIAGVCQLSTSTNMHIVYNDASGVATTSDLGSSYPCNDSQYNYYISIEQTTTSYIITVERVTVATGASISTSLTTSTNIPVYNTGIIQLFTFITNNATASVASYLDGGAIGSFKN